MDITVILNENGDKYIGEPIISKETVDGKDFYKYVYSDIAIKDADEMRIVKK